MRKGNSNFKKNKEDYVLLFFLTVVMVVLVVAIFKSNLEVIPEHISLIKEKSIPLLWVGPLARVHMENFHHT